MVRGIDVYPLILGCFWVHGRSSRSIFNVFVCSQDHRATIGPTLQSCPRNSFSQKTVLESESAIHLPGKVFRDQGLEMNLHTTLDWTIYVEVFTKIIGYDLPFENFI